MPSGPKNIDPEEWAAHKPYILELRRKGVRLGGDGGIIETMAKECKFKATPSQYQLQFSKWRSSANLSPDQWRDVLQVYKQNETGGAKVDVYKHDRLVLPKELKRKWKEHCEGSSDYAKRRLIGALASSIPDCIEFRTLDVIGGSAEASSGHEYSESSMSVSSNLATPSATPLSSAASSQQGVASSSQQDSSYWVNHIAGLDPAPQEPDLSLVTTPSPFPAAQSISPLTYGSNTTSAPSYTGPVPFNHTEEADTSQPTSEANLMIPDYILSSPSNPLSIQPWSGAGVNFGSGLPPLVRSDDFPGIEGDMDSSRQPLLMVQQSTVSQNFPSSAFTDHNQMGVNFTAPDTNQPPLRPLQDKSSDVGEMNPLIRLHETGLSSLLPPDDGWSDTPFGIRTAAQRELFGSSAFRSLIFAIENNFAGLDGVPIGDILRFLTQDPQMRSRIPHYLRINPKNASKALAEKLIRAAIENGDASFVTELSTDFVTANEVVCSFNGRRYTAVERSAMLRNIDVTAALLRAGADVNKTYEKDPREERGALELAFGKLGNFAPEDVVGMNLINLLLCYDAKVSMNLANACVRRGQTGLIRRLLVKVSPLEHSSAFEENGILFSALRVLDNELATVVVRRIFQQCSESGCNKCPGSEPQLTEVLAILAAEREFLDLVVFLVNYVIDPSRLLVGAVRSGRKDIIDCLLTKGAKVDVPAFVIGKRPISLSELSTVSPPVELLQVKNKELGIPSPLNTESLAHLLRVEHSGLRTSSLLRTTPLAEAVRLGDPEIIHDLENRGALSQINEKSRFAAAIFAATEVGNLAYVSKLLHIVIDIDGKSLSLSLSVAIKKRHGQIALSLLQAGADVNERISSPSLKQPLHEALLQRDETLVRKILDCDIGVGRLRHREALEAAICWGEISIIKDMLSLGARFEFAEVMIAVRARNKPLVELLINHGANLNRALGWSASPLEAAISNKDIPILQYLLQSGADPSCPSAWSSSALQEREIFDIMIHAFRCRYPKGKAGFGSAALHSAIEREDLKRVDMLLEAGSNVNSVFDTESFKRKNTLGMAIAKYGGRRLDIIEKILMAGGDPNSVVSRPGDYESDTVWPQRTALLEAIQTKSVDLVRFLVAKGADIHRSARLGIKRTPLQYACEIGSTEIVDLLLFYGANVNEEPATRGGATALQLCAIQGYCKIAFKLLARGANVWAAPAEYNGQTAFEGAAENGRLDMLMMLWQLAIQFNFSEEQRERTMKLAEDNGHIACSEFIQGLFLPRHEPSQTHLLTWDAQLSEDFTVGGESCTRS